MTRIWRKRGARYQSKPQLIGTLIIQANGRRKPLWYTLAEAPVKLQALMEAAIDDMPAIHQSMFPPPRK
jgi:hypothetical protein